MYRTTDEGDWLDQPYLHLARRLHPAARAGKPSGEGTMNDRPPTERPETAPNAKEERPRRRAWDIPLLIKLILLLVVIWLLGAEIYAGEFDRPGAIQWLILLFKILLIIGLIGLIWVQRSLRCEITAPTGCVKEQSDIPTGQVFVRVLGSAGGAVFGHYTLAITQDGDPPMAGLVTYPGGGSSGSVPVAGAELGRINTSSLIDGAYTVTLTVYPAGWGSPRVCVVSFNLLKVFVVINAVGTIGAMTMVPVPDNPNPFDESASLRKDVASAPPPHDFEPVAVGGSLSIDGSAYIYGCTDRKITRYEIRYARVTAPGGDHPQPAPLAAIPAAWPVGQRIELLEYPGPDYYRPWTRVGLAPRNLINSWTTITFFGTTYFMLQESRWNSTGLSGRYSLLLSAEDSIGARFHDIQHVWLDNEPVYGQITGIAGVAACADLHLSQFASSGMTIEGIAWDRLIDELFPDTAPNDNFAGYSLSLTKQGGGTYSIGSFATRVIAPFRKIGPAPTVAEAADLATFDIASVIDAADPASDPRVNIPRGTGCAYYLELVVSDETRLNDDTATHTASWIWPFCITNDLRPAARV